MDHLETKEKTLAHLDELERDIQRLAIEKSLATLDHKLSQRQKVLEYLFSTFIEQLNENDIQYLQSIQKKSHAFIEEIESNKYEQSQEIIKYKNTGKRIRLYTDIAQHK